MRLSGTKTNSIHQYRGLGDQLWDISGTRPSLDLRFADSKSLVDATTGQNLVTFTRASSGTYVGSDGVLKTATTNLLLRSEEFDDAYWTKTNSTVNANATTAPNGALTAEKLITNSGASSGRVNVSITATADTPVTLSCYAKQGETNIFGLFISDGITGRAADFNLTTGTVSGTPTAGMTASIQPVGDGWYRCVVTVAGASLSGTTRSLRIVQTVVANDGTSGLFIWGAQFEQSTTAGEYIPTTSTINSAPRFDHNPTTGESLGLLVEEQRTNSIRNNTMVGAVAGTPGTLPTNWVFIAGTTGISSQVVETGIVNGINYIDIRYFGTAAATSSFSQRFEGATSIAALTGQTWALSTWTKIQAGSTSGITAINHQYAENTSAGAFVTSGTTAITVDSNLTRHTSTRTLSGGATVAFLAGGISVTVTSGQAIDITLRIGLPQLEQGAFATSVIPTTGTTVTRSADVASITGTNFSSWYRQDEGTVRVQGQLVGGAASTFPYMAALTGANKDTDVIGIPWTATSSVIRGIVVSSGSGSVDLNTGPNKVAGSNYAAALAASATSANVSVDGFIASDDTTVVIPVITQLLIGQPARFQPTANTTIRRLTYWPARLPNPTLQDITR